MIDQTQVTKVADFLKLSPQAFLVLPASNNPDLVLSGLANYLFIQDLIELKGEDETFKLEALSLFAPKKLTLFKKWPKLLTFIKENKLLDDLKTELGKDNLIISFPYQEAQVDKVSYHLSDDNKSFYLTIKPQKGQAPLDSDQVEFSYAGAQADLLMLLGVGDLENLEQLYFGYEDLYKNAASVTINTYIPDFGSLNLDTSGSVAYGEAIFYYLKSLATLFDLDLAAFAQIDLIATLL